MNKNKKSDTIQLVIVIILIIIAIAEILNIWLPKKHASERRLLEVRYEQQSVALGMAMSKEFVGIDEYSEENFITLRYYLAAFQEAVGEDDTLTVEEVKQYLSSEYDENGKLAIENRPASFDKYFDWFWNGGEQYTHYYDYWINAYKKDHMDKYDDMGKYDMTEEQTMSLLEDFKNCSEKLEYKEMYREKYNYESFEVTSRDYYLGLY